MPNMSISKNIRQELKIPCTLIRGGTSKGPFFLASDLPTDEQDRDTVLLSVMGSPHPFQVDGIGGGVPQASKVAIVSSSNENGIDVDYLFAQVMVNDAIVDTKPNCGNMLSGVGSFAIEKGLVKVIDFTEDSMTLVRIRNLNTGAIVHAEVKTPNGETSYLGNEELAGVCGTSAPVNLHFFNAEGVKTGKWFPTGNMQDVIDGIKVTLIDYSVPMIHIKASDLGITGYESFEEIDNNKSLLARIEKIRISAGSMMGLGDVSDAVIPKVSLLAAPRNGGTVSSRYLMPWNCHKSHAVTGAMCIASSCYKEGTVCAELLPSKLKEDQAVKIEHPTGDISLSVKLEQMDSRVHIEKITVVRTARKLFEGYVYALI